MKKSGILFADISEKAVMIITFFLLAVLTVWAGQDTYGYPEDYSSEFLIWQEDNLFRHFLVFAVVMIVTGVAARLLFRGKDETQKRRIVKWCAAVEMVLVGIMLTVWVSLTQFNQYRDAGQVCYITGQFMKGDYEYMSSSYLQGVQYQLGLIFLEELILSIWPDICIFQYLNVVFILGILFFLYRITDQLFHNQTVNLYCLVGTAAFLPLHFYVNLAYGDICSTSLSLLVIWALLRWGMTRHKRYIVMTAVGLTISMLARKSTMIILIAVVICLMIQAWKEWNWRPVVIALLITVLPFAGTNFVSQYYQQRSGIEMGDSIPAVLWIAMGLHGEPGGYGTYNGYHESVFWYTGRNAEEASRIAWIYIRERLNEFKDNPYMAYDFYKNKILQQWGESTYGSMILTLDKDRCGEEIVDRVYFGDVRTSLLSYMNSYSFLLYFGAFLYVVLHLRQKSGIWQSLLLIVIVGGILFSMLWENKSRYVLPYVICMIPYMACGLYEIQNILFNRCTPVRKIFDKIS